MLFWWVLVGSGVVLMGFWRVLLVSGWFLVVSNGFWWFLVSSDVLTGSNGLWWVLVDSGGF